jgi:hypothetical protein
MQESDIISMQILVLSVRSMHDFIEDCCAKVSEFVALDSSEEWKRA